MQLRKPEALAVFDHHDGRIADIDADLNDHRRNQHVQFSMLKRLHDCVLFLLLHRAMHQTDAQMRIACTKLLIELLRRFAVDAFGFFDQRRDNISLPALLHLRRHEIVNFRSGILIPEKGPNRLAPGGQCINDRNIKIPVQNHRQRPRDRRRRHDQYVRIFAFGMKHFALIDTETMLLIRHKQTGLGKHHIRLQDCMRTDQDIDLAGSQRRKQFPALRRLSAARQQRRPDTERCKRPAEICVMLL